MNEKIFTKNFYFVFLSMFFSGLVMYLLMTIMVGYAQNMGASVTIAGLLSGIYVVGALCSRFFSSRIMEQLGWKRAAIVFLAIHLVASAGYFIDAGIVFLLLVRFIHGIGFGTGINATISIGMSILPRSRYAEASGYLMMAPSLAIGIGPFLGGWLYDLAPNACFIMATLFAALTLLFIMLVDTSAFDPGPQRSKSKDMRPHGISAYLELSALPLAFCIFMTAVGYSSIMAFYRVYAEEMDLITQFTYFFPIYAVILAAARPCAGRLQDRFGDDIICTVGFLTQIIGLGALAMSPCMMTIILCAIGCALGFGTLSSCCNAIVCRDAPQGRRSYSVTTFWLLCDAGMGAGPLLLGAVASASSYTAMYIFSALVTAVSLPIYWMVHRRMKNRRHH